jgi:RNA polymerase sigma-70 factor (ECF subfamily)
MTGAAPSATHAEDLALAVACVRREPAALEALDRVIVTSVARAVIRMDDSQAFRDLVAQEVRTRLLIGEPPRIAEYAGRGPLAAWIKTAAVRTALNLRRGVAERGHDPLASSLGEASTGPEIDLLRARYRVEFEEALRAALGRLSPRWRAVLALQVRDGMSSDKIAAMYRVGRSTAKRWLVAAREELALETRRELGARLTLTPSELESVGAALVSAMHVSIARLLEPAEHAEPES